MPAPDALPHLHRHLLKHAVGARAHSEGGHLVPLQLGQGAQLVNVRLHGQLRSSSEPTYRQAFLFHLPAVVQLFGGRHRELAVQFDQQPRLVPGCPGPPAASPGGSRTGA